MFGFHTNFVATARQRVTALHLAIRCQGILCGLMMSLHVSSSVLCHFPSLDDSQISRQRGILEVYGSRPSISLIAGRFMPHIPVRSEAVKLMIALKLTPRLVVLLS